ncbi:unnamed protein product [Brassica rapa]|uniref:NB-ARC domain-containing protein n=1 Tax=Brassica campestris TaxID=3711 RepID=A0A8D9G3T4_BRACM|nr:unnamed protein product [Brassica rapa]
MGNCFSLNFSCDKALDQTYGCLFGERNYIHMMEANLEALERATEKLEERRDDLLTRVSIEEDKGLQRLAQVEGWLSRVARIDSQVSDLLTTKPTETKRLCIFGYCSTKCISSCEYGKKVSKKLKEVNELYPQGDFKDVAGKKLAAKVLTKEIQATIGLDSMVGKAWDSIMKPERRALGIYGMGGVGKTTLLTHINNKLEKEVNGFDVVIWVVVSQDLQYKGIQDQIPGMEEKILSILKFSYDGLEEEKVKSCFQYCSLFPEDYEITKEELIEYWISEGFIKGERDEDGSNNQGHVIIG